MKRFLTIIRRIFLGAIVSLLLCLFLLEIGGNRMIDLAMPPKSFIGVFCLLLIISPIAYILLTIISAAYIRKHGQFAEFHQTQSPVTSFFRCIGHDLASPFVNIKNMFFAIFKKDETFGRGVIIRRFIGMLVLILFFLAGIGLLLQ